MAALRATLHLDKKMSVSAERMLIFTASGKLRYLKGNIYHNYR